MIKRIMLQRPRLIKMMDDLADNRLIYIHAPGGYGKTTAAQLWIEYMEMSHAKAATIALDELDNKAASFWNRLARALLSLQPDNGRMSALLLHSSFSSAPDEFTIQALGEFETNETVHIISFDDLHVIDNEHIIRFLPIICRRIPSNIVLLFLSRQSPPDVFAEYITKGNMGIINSGHLRFSADEIKTLFSENNRRVTSEQAGKMFTSTGGWIIGLTSILLSGENVYDANFTSRYLETFFKSSLWSKWDKNIKTFLMNVSLVEEFTPQLANALDEGKHSEDFVQRLMSENIFIRNIAPDTYALHDLFREFLIKMLISEQGEEYKNKQLKKAADWFYKQKDYYRAIAYYLKSGHTAGVSKSFTFIYDYNAPYVSSIEDTLDIIHLAINEELIARYPFHLEALAYAAWLEGRGEDMAAYLERYFKLLPRIIIRNPASASTALMMKSMDYRNSFIDLTKQFKKLPLKLFTSANTPSLTQNFPLLHRSARDFSEYRTNPEQDLPLLYKTFGLFYKTERDTLIHSLRAGHSYECGNLDGALELAFVAKANMQNTFAPEIQFCCWMIIVSILDAQRDEIGAQKIRTNIDEMIEMHKAYYLYANFRAYRYRLLLSEGDRTAAKKWLSQYAIPINSALPFYKMYQGFTTARAYIVISDYNSAILILNDILKLSEDYRRPLDTIEACILLAVVYWRKRGGQPHAINFLEKAIAIAYPYGYTQLFINESPDIETMLSRIQKRIVQSDKPSVPAAFVKSLYLTALTFSKRRKGLTGRKQEPHLSFTDKQKTAMRLLCEGYSQSEIAEKMNTSTNNVKSHIKLIYRKLDVSNAVDAIMRINEIGVLNDKK